MFMNKMENYPMMREKNPEWTGMFRNLDTPEGNMAYEVERLMSYYGVKMLLPASQLSNHGFFYDSKSRKITCFYCKLAYETNVCNITHKPSCAYKQNSISFYVDEKFVSIASSFRHITNQHSPSPPTTSTRKPDMKNEADRLKTFTKWDKNVPVEPADLARNGFYFKGYADVVMCAYCSLELRNWEQGDNVYTEHQRHTPTCPFLATVSELPESLPTPNMKYEQNRLKTFANCSDVFAVNTKALAQNGFYFTGPEDKVRCNSCDCELSTWKREDNIKQRHQSQSPNCEFVLRSDSASLTHYRSNIIFDRPKQPQFALLTDRLKTFVNWPADKKQTPQLLAESGFYHTGETDTVICYCCDGGLCNWDEDDDPWTEHARWYPRCTYVRQRKGDQFVVSVRKDKNSYSSGSDATDIPLEENRNEPIPTTSGTQGGPTPNSDAQAEENVADSRIPQSILKRPTVLAVLGLGYDEKIVEYVVKKKIKETGSAFAKASLLLEAVVNYIEEVGHVVPESHQEEFEQHDAMVNPEKNLNLDTKLREENRLLKEQKTCKICLDEDLSIVFLPCGHFVSCATCAPSLKTCPVCRSQILGLVRAYLS